MINASQIREHMEVVGSDGRHVGRVDKLMGDEIELAMLDSASGFKHHLIPLTWVDHIEGDKLCLNRTRDSARAGWRDRR